MSITAEFIGGPHDGLIQALPDLRSPYLFPIEQSLALADYLGAVAPSVLTYLVYEVDLDPEMKRPSLSDEGRYRYRYAGIR